MGTRPAKDTKTANLHLLSSVGTNGVDHNPLLEFKRQKLDDRVRSGIGKDASQVTEQFLIEHLPQSFEFMELAERPTFAPYLQRMGVKGAVTARKIANIVLSAEDVPERQLTQLQSATRQDLISCLLAFQNDKIFRSLTNKERMDFIDRKGGPAKIAKDWRAEQKQRQPKTKKVLQLTIAYKELELRAFKAGRSVEEQSLFEQDQEKANEGQKRELRAFDAVRQMADKQGKTIPPKILNTRPRPKMKVDVGGVEIEVPQTLALRWLAELLPEGETSTQAA